MELLELYFDENIHQFIVQETYKYATQEGVLLKLYASELKIVIGIILLSEYAKVLFRKNYWKSSLDKHNALESNVIKRNRFQ